MLKDCRILIVEDEPIIAMDLRDTLNGYGACVQDTLTSGEEALEFCRKTPADLVLMDVRLLGEMNGVQAAALLRQEMQIPSVLLTAYCDEEMVRDSQRAGVIGYLIKPYDDRELYATLSTSLHRFREEQILRRQVESRPQRATMPEAETNHRLRVRTFGRSCTLQLNGNELCIERLPPQPRDMLALLLSAGNYRIRREEVEGILWPDSPTDKARSSFDTTLLRLRRSIRELTGSGDEKDYLSLRRGFLALENADVDLCRFNRLDSESRRQIRHDPGAARAALEELVQLWECDYLAQISQLDTVSQIRRQTTRSFLDLSWKLAEIYAEAGQSREALAVLDRLLSIDAAHEAATALSLRLLQRQPAPAAFRQRLRSFEEALYADGLTRAEVLLSLRRVTLQN